MSADVGVTREHRARAVAALGIASELHARKWVETANPDASNADMRDVATALATAEHNLRAAVIADLRGLVERADIVDQGSSVLYVRADSIELLIETLEDAQ